MRPIFVLCGDSITQYAASPDNGGFMCDLANTFVRSLDLNNRGFIGYNTRQFRTQVLPDLQNDYAVVKPQLWTLWLGANDAALANGTSSEQHVPLEEYGENLKYIAEMLLNLSNNSKVLLITPSPVIDSTRKRDACGNVDRTNAETGRYARRCVEVGAELAKANLNVKTLNVYDPINALSEELHASYFVDGLHLSNLGNKYISKLLTAEVKEAFPDLHDEQ